MPLLSLRWMTVISRSGSDLPVFSFLIAGSFHFLIVPRKMSGEDVAVELDVVRQPVAVVGDRGRRERPRDLDAALAGGELVGRQRCVARAEVDRAVRDRVDAAARADRPVRHLDAVRRVDLRDPGRHERRDERAAGAGQGSGGRCFERRLRWPRTSAAPIAARTASVLRVTIAPLRLVHVIDERARAPSVAWEERWLQSGDKVVNARLRKPNRSVALARW